MVKQKLVEKINDAKVELSKMSSGFSIADLVDNIKIHPLIGEFFDRERMKSQESSERENISFNNNKAEIVKNVYSMICETVMMPNEKSINHHPLL